MTKFYATNELNDSCTDIAEWGKIQEFDTLEEAQAHAASPWAASVADYNADPEEEGTKEVFEFDDAFMGDCWFKSHDRIDPADLADDDWFKRMGLADFEGISDMVSELAPGQHPGGYGYWYNFCEDVIIANVKRVQA